MRDRAGLIHAKIAQGFGGLVALHAGQNQSVPDSAWTSPNHPPPFHARCNCELLDGNRGQGNRRRLTPARNDSGRSRHFREQLNERGVDVIVVPPLPMLFQKIGLDELAQVLRRRLARYTEILFDELDSSVRMPK